jgi:hypothetical protein
MPGTAHHAGTGAARKTFARSPADYGNDRKAGQVGKIVSSMACRPMLRAVAVLLVSRENGKRNVPGVRLRLFARTQRIAAHCAKRQPVSSAVGSALVITTPRRQRPEWVECRGQVAGASALLSEYGTVRSIGGSPVCSGLAAGGRRIRTVGPSHKIPRSLSPVRTRLAAGGRGIRTLGPLMPAFDAR